MLCSHYIGALSCVQVYELVREKVTGQRITRHGSIFRSSHFTSDHDNSRRVSAVSNSSYSTLEMNRQVPQTSAIPPSSSLGEKGSNMITQPPTLLLEEVAEGMPGESPDKKALHEVTRANSDDDDERLLGHLSEPRRPSILKFPPIKPALDKRIPHHVQFAESKEPM